MTSLSAERLDDLVLARLAATPAPRRADLLSAVRRFWPAAAPDHIEAALQRLERAGSRAQDALTADGRSAARRLAAAGVRWTSVADTYLPAHALGWTAPDKRVRARLEGREGWAAAIVARDLDLIAAGDAPPTPTQVGALIVWRMLGLPGKPARQMPGAIAAHFVRDLLAADIGDWKRGLVQLAARSVVAPRADLKALRDGVVHAWLGGRSWTRASRTLGANSAGRAQPDAAPPAAPAAPPRAAGSNTLPTDLEGFARHVREAARRVRHGVFGDRKVFISALWRELDAHSDASVSLDEFKRNLVEANRRGLLRLYRADLVEEMDPAEVAASATRYLDATFHFVEREATPS